MAVNDFVPKRRLNNDHRVHLEKHLLEKHYVFLQVKVTGGVLYALGSCKPSEYSATYSYKLKYIPGKSPKVYPVTPEIKYDPEIHLYSEDNRLCLYFPNDESWTETSRLFNTIIPWTQEWFLFYELYLITGKWLHPYVEHRKI